MIKNAKQKVIDYFNEHPDASYGDAAKALGCSKSTINKYKPNKTPQLSEEEAYALYERYIKEKLALEKFPWESIKWFRYANDYKLYPIEWGRIRAYAVKRGDCIPCGLQSAEELEKRLKEVLDLLYDYDLYSECPVCRKGILVPIWESAGQGWPFCGCSDCDYVINRDGEIEKPALFKNRTMHLRKDSYVAISQPVSDKSKIICLDVETTGLDFLDDEILQISIIDGNGNVLFNEYIRPKEKTEWAEAEAIHGISPEMLQNKPTIDEYIQKLNQIMASAELIVGYNSDYFDLEFIQNAGVNVPDETPTFDVMLEFAPIYGEWNNYHHDYTWQKLNVCAAFYEYDWGKDKAHDSLADVKATLHCFCAMIQGK